MRLHLLVDSHARRGIMCKGRAIIRREDKMLYLRGPEHTCPYKHKDDDYYII